MAQAKVIQGGIDPQMADARNAVRGALDNAQALFCILIDDKGNETTVSLAPIPLMPHMLGQVHARLCQGSLSCLQQQQQMAAQEPPPELPPAP